MNSLDSCNTESIFYGTDLYMHNPSCLNERQKQKNKTKTQRKNKFKNEETEMALFKNICHFYEHD